MTPTSPSEGILHTEIDYRVSSSDNNTDIIYQEVQLYIEGVQIPFLGISISQALGNIPSASIAVPPSPGLMDIAKYYQPKVHIFYTDNITGGQRLLFWGHITSCRYSMSVRSNEITFECVHKNHLLNQVTIDFKGYAAEGSSHSNPNEFNSVYKATDFGSPMGLLRAMNGINGLRVEPSATTVDQQISPLNRAKVLEMDTAKLDYSLRDLLGRYVGIPSALMNMWNQMRMSTYSAEENNIILSKMYIPLLEDGIAFFKRISGHSYIETMIHDGRYDVCNIHGKSTGTQMVPPSFRLNTTAAIQTMLTNMVTQAGAGFSGEATGLLKMFNDFFYSIEYEVLTLASPASVPADVTSYEIGKEMMAIETIIKPQLPFYFSPICNVILPNMYSSVQVAQEDTSTYTRVDAIYEPQQTGGELGVTYRGPHSIREAIVKGFKLNPGDPNAAALTLEKTTAFSHNIPGKYELGTGFRPKRMAMPQWLASLSVDRKNSATNANAEVLPDKGTIASQMLKDLHSAWIDRYGYSIDNEGNRKRDPSKDTLSPFSEVSNVKAYERILFSHVDYDFTKNIMSSRTGSLSGIFNPYIIPGYPMDIIAKSPNHPSFHALCSSVTHSITANSISTSISFMAASTYSELSNYHVMPAHPWLQVALNIVNVTRAPGQDEETSVVSTNTEGAGPSTTNDAPFTAIQATQNNTSFTGNTGNVLEVQSTIINNLKAKETADKFYMDVLGVGATSPSDLVEFNTMMGTAQVRINGYLTPHGSPESIPMPNGGEGNNNLTTSGNLKLVHRLIESKDNLIEKFGYKFIDLNSTNYSLDSIALRNDRISDATLVEPGASMFLDYPEIDQFLVDSGLTSMTPPT